VPSTARNGADESSNQDLSREDCISPVMASGVQKRWRQLDGTARVWELPFLPLPTPLWLSELAEAIARVPFDDQWTIQFESGISPKSNTR
jgi:hypothetical protein